MGDEDLRAGGLSRRDALKRLGGGAALAWSVPTLLSTDLAGAAGSPPPPTTVPPPPSTTTSTTSTTTTTTPCSVDPAVQAVVCPVLLANRDSINAAFDALIAAFPLLAPQLEAARAAALAVIDVQIAQFCCE